MFRRLLALLTLLQAVVSPVYAADIYCGHDDDESGAYDVACYTAAKDKDHDGYTTDGTAGQFGDTDIDCDDTNWKIGTDAWIDAGGGTVKRCKADGTYTTAKAVSALTASDISATSSSLKFLSATGSTSSGCGAFGTPCDPRCLVDSGRACYVAPAAGSNDTFWWLPGTYANNATATNPGAGATNSLFLISNIDGTSAHPFINIADPTGTVLLDSPGTDLATLSRPLELDDSDYWKWFGFNVGNGFAGVGVYFNSGSNNLFIYGKIYNVDGRHEDNPAGWISNGGDNNILRATLLKDNYDRAAPTDQNCAAVVNFSGTNNKILFNSIFNTSTVSYGGIKFKHGAPLSPGYSVGNHILNFYRLGVGWDTGGFIAKNNYVKGKSSDNYFVCFDQHDWGGTPFYDMESVVFHNTCIDGGLANSTPQDSGGLATGLASPYFLTIENNAMIDSATQYNYEDSGSPFHDVYSFAYYADATFYAAMNGKFRTRNNCIYNSSTGGFKGSFAGNLDASRKYGSWAGWTGAGYDAGSVNTDCACGTDGRCTTVITTGVFGDAPASTTAPTTVSTTVTSTSTTSVPGGTGPTLGRFRDRGRGSL